MVGRGDHQNETPCQKAKGYFFPQGFLADLESAPGDNPGKRGQEQAIDHSINHPSPKYQPSQIGSANLSVSGLDNTFCTIKASKANPRKMAQPHLLETHSWIFKK